MQFQNNLLSLSPDPKDNIIKYEGQFYSVNFLHKPNQYVQGGNGMIFKLVGANSDEFVIKFLKFPQERKVEKYFYKRILRFDIEIEALFVAKDNSISNVIDIKFTDYLKIDNMEFRYYVMEKCDCNLKEYLAKPENDLDINQRTLLCQKIFNGIRTLNEYKIYHRDIKHENIFFIGNEPYIGDLGLARNRNSDIKINEKGDLIGPTGWFSPEALNKSLVENTVNLNSFDCNIDEKSEIFQLGKLFWFIYQGNLPIGQLSKEDFVGNNSNLYNLLYYMLQYSKARRYSELEVARELESFLSRN